MKPTSRRGLCRALAGAVVGAPVVGCARGRAESVSRAIRLTPARRLDREAHIPLGAVRYVLRTALTDDPKLFVGAPTYVPWVVRRQSLQTVAEWWDSTRPRDVVCDVLVLANRTGGYGLYDDGTAVAGHAPGTRGAWLLLHEIGHAFGLRHHHADEDAWTIMRNWDDLPADVTPEFRFSATSRRVLNESV